MDRTDLGERRLDYDAGMLLDDAPSDPHELFGRWLNDATRAQDDGEAFEATAMTLTTARRLKGGMWQPNSRIVLLKGVDAGGFVFYTNYESVKASELACNPHCCLQFYWHPLQRQVRIQGIASRLDADDNDYYFETRPRGSQLSAWASPQSQPIASREELEQRVAAIAERFTGEIPRPPHWGGYRVQPHTIEFWQGRTNRLHDRLSYTVSGQTWNRQRLAP